MTHEIEYKWKARSIRDYQNFLNAAQKAGAKITSSEKIAIQDFYLDTPDSHFGNSRKKCRIRITNKKTELTFKSASISKAGLVIRREKNIALPRFKTVQTALPHCRKKIFQNLLGHDRIKPIFKIKNKRLLHTLKFPGNITAESCFDDVFLLRGSKKAHMNEIELELLKGNLNKFKFFAVRITRISKLKTAKKSKFATAMRKLFGKK